MRVNMTQNNNPNFSAKLQLQGNIHLLENEGIKILGKITQDIGTNKDIIDICIAKAQKNNEVSVNIAGYVNNILNQFSKIVKKNELLSEISLILEKFKNFSNINKKSKDYSVEFKDIALVHILARLDDSIFENNIKELKQILDIDADFINSPIDITTGMRGINYIARDNQVDAMNLILKRPDINVNVQNLEGWTPLHLASYNNNIECAKILLKRDDINIYIKNIKGKIPEELANSRDMINLFKEYKNNRKI